MTPIPGLKKIKAAILFACLCSWPCLAKGQPKEERRGDSLEFCKTKIQTCFIQNDTINLKYWFSKAKNERGKLLGKPSLDLDFVRPDTSEVSSDEVLRIWNLSLDELVPGNSLCPEPATETPAAMLGLFYAGEAGQIPVSASFLSEISNSLLGLQFRKDVCEVPPGYPSGVFGFPYLADGEECKTYPTIQRVSKLWCSRYNESCVVYNGGPFSGKRFFIRDQFPGVSIWDSPLSSQTAWGTEEMIYSFIHLKDSAFYRSALLAGSWMVQEKPVLNHSLTARNIWGLAALYDLSGNLVFRDEIVRRLTYALLPGVLMDQNLDGIVDGTSVPFDSLSDCAKVPGRMWDQVNSSAWNGSVNALAVLNAYTSLRDRGDVAMAQKLLPYVDAMISNLCSEILTKGTPPEGSGFKDLSFLILEALWKIDVAEKKRHISWEKAAYALWNTGILRTGKEQLVVLGQYVRWKKSKNYRARFTLAAP
jgi:hypothetical protein